MRIFSLFIVLGCCLLSCQSNSQAVDELRNKLPEITPLFLSFLIKTSTSKR
jgi:hypothetical protein